jgi:hypothetical protein
MNPNTAQHDKTLNISEILSVLSETLPTTTVVVCLAYELPKTPITFGRLQLADALAEDFRHIARDYLDHLQHQQDANDIRFVPYDPAIMPDNYEIEIYPLDNHDKIHTQLADLENLQQITLFEPTKARIENLKFYVVALQNNAENIGYFFRAYTKTREISRSKIAVLFQGGVYDRIREPVFIFDYKIDCFYSNGYLFIENRNNFQRIFRILEEIRETAAVEALHTLQTSLPVQNFDVFAEQCRKNLIMSVKLCNIVNRPYFKNLTLDILKRTIATQKLSLQIESGTQGDQLVFDPAKKWEFLRLLDDGFMTSDMTGTAYEVIGKRTR